MKILLIIAGIGVIMAAALLWVFNNPETLQPAYSGNCLSCLPATISQRPDDRHSGSGGIETTGVVNVKSVKQSPTQPTPVLPPIKKCTGAEVRSLKNVSVVDNGSKSWIDLEPTPSAYTQVMKVSDQEITITAVGPILGSMDSPDVRVNLACIDGVALVATITRSANYDGSVLQNINWRPRLDIEVQLRRPEITFQTTWVMRLDTGGQPRFTETPPFQPVTYPVSITTTIH